jgi:hypothetical protein
MLQEKVYSYVDFQSCFLLHHLPLALASYFFIFRRICAQEGTNMTTASSVREQWNTLRKAELIFMKVDTKKSKVC